MITKSLSRFDVKGYGGGGGLEIPPVISYESVLRRKIEELVNRIYLLEKKLEELYLRPKMPFTQGYLPGDVLAFDPPGIYRSPGQPRWYRSGGPTTPDTTFIITRIAIATSTSVVATSIRFPSEPGIFDGDWITPGEIPGNYLIWAYDGYWSGTNWITPGEIPGNYQYWKFDGYYEQIEAYTYYIEWATRINYQFIYYGITIYTTELDNYTLTQKYYFLYDQVTFTGENFQYGPGWYINYTDVAYGDPFWGTVNITIYDVVPTFTITLPQYWVLK